jgi:hypothetical protein
VQRDRWFEKSIRRKGFIIKQMEEDGACLFRAVADQVYGDQEMHAVVRSHCMDYIVSIIHGRKVISLCTVVRMYEVFKISSRTEFKVLGACVISCN